MLNWRPPCASGWDKSSRECNLLPLVNNSRFLILPWVRVPHLASHTLALAPRRVPADREARYGLRPWLVETLVDPERFAGTCHRAANWLDVDLTTGRSRHNAALKRIFIYPLHADAQRMLASVP